MTDLKQYFGYLDAVASDIEYSFVRARSGPVFYNVPGPTKLMAHFGIDGETAVAAFAAWKEARKWKHPQPMLIGLTPLRHEDLFDQKVEVRGLFAAG